MTMATAATQQIPPSVPRLVDVPTAAGLLGVSASFVRKAIRLDKLPSVRMGRRLLVRTKDIDAAIDAGGIPTKSA